MPLLEDPCGFIVGPVLSPLMYSTGQPVMRGDVQLLYHEQRCGFESRAAGTTIWIQPFYPPNYSDDELAEIARNGAPGVTDLASIPKLGRPAVAPNGRILKPSLKHDHAYETMGFGGLITRHQANAELRDDLWAVGSPFIERQTVFWATELGGAAGWGH